MVSVTLCVTDSGLYDFVSRSPEVMRVGVVFPASCAVLPRISYAELTLPTTVLVRPGQSLKPCETRTRSKEIGNPLGPAALSTWLAFWNGSGHHIRSMEEV